jgi:pimeloyl-ACP methyl ester carboxylesterase
MAEDMIEVMESLGHQRFFLAGHDRGARLSHRLCLDHPDRVVKLCLLDMLPNYYVWTNANMKWALGTWHWLFMAQPEPFPETMMSAVPAEWFLKSRGGNRNPPKIVSDEYIRCFTKKTIIGSCRDYRAGATIDFAMDSADKDRQIGMPLLILWGTRGAPPHRVAQIREQSRRCAAAPDRPLPAGGSTRPSLRSFRQILHDVIGEAGFTRDLRKGFHPEHGTYRAGATFGIASQLQRFPITLTLLVTGDPARPRRAATITFGRRKR